MERCTSKLPFVLMWKLIYCTSLSNGISYWLVLSDKLWHNTDGSSKSNCWIWGFFYELTKIQLRLKRCQWRCCVWSAAATSVHLATGERWRSSGVCKQHVNMMLEVSRRLPGEPGARETLDTFYYSNNCCSLRGGRCPREPHTRV